MIHDYIYSIILSYIYSHWWWYHRSSIIDGSSSPPVGPGHQGSAQRGFAARFARAKTKATWVSSASPMPAGFTGFRIHKARLILIDSLIKFMGIHIHLGWGVGTNVAQRKILRNRWFEARIWAGIMFRKRWGVWHSRTAVSVHATAVAVAVKPYVHHRYRSGRVKSFTTRIGRW